MKSDLSNELREQARACGLCDKWYREWGTPDEQGLIDKYIKGIDFAIEHDFPSVEFIKKRFDRELLHENKIFADEEVSLLNPNGVIVLNGECLGHIVFDGFPAADMYVRHNSDVLIECMQESKVFISLYDRARVHVKQYDNAKVYMYRQSEDCVVEVEGDVMVRG